MGTRCVHRPRAVYPGSLGGVAAPLVLLLCPCVVRHTLTGPTRISLAPSCRLRVHRRPRIGSSVPSFSLASPASLSHRILLVCPLPSTAQHPSFTPIVHRLALARKVTRCWAAASEATVGVSNCCGVCASCSSTSSCCSACCGASSSTTIQHHIFAVSHLSLLSCSLLICAHTLFLTLL